jgi:hypothetical protein
LSFLAAAVVVTRRILGGTGRIYSLGSFVDDAATPAEEETESFDDADDVKADAAAGAEVDVVGISSLIKSPHTLAIAGSIAGSPDEDDAPPVVLRRPPTGAMP